MKLTVSTMRCPVQSGAQPTEVVERKGLGHPDSICDALAERLSEALCEHYLQIYGEIRHFNVDKALLWGGSSRAAFGGGEVTAPIEIFLAGRASFGGADAKEALDGLARRVSTLWLKDNLHALDVERHVKIHSLLRPTSPDLRDIYRRQRQTGRWLANDTSCGVGFAPLTDLERLVLAVEQGLTAPSARRDHPEVGEDVKVLAVRDGRKVSLTVSCAFVSAHIPSLRDYAEKKTTLAERARRLASDVTPDLALDVNVNAGDDLASGAVFLTVTGTSAESGDDGEVGRGNRANGLITPYRPMTMEAVAGKNPVTHVGKLYNVAASRVARLIVAEVPEIAAADCFLVSRIGEPVDEPALVDLRVELGRDASLTDALTHRLETLVLGDLRLLGRDAFKST